MTASLRTMFGFGSAASSGASSAGSGLFEWTSHSNPVSSGSRSNSTDSSSSSSSSMKLRLVRQPSSMSSTDSETIVSSSNSTEVSVVGVEDAMDEGGMRKRLREAATNNGSSRISSGAMDGYRTPTLVALRKRVETTKKSGTTAQDQHQLESFDDMDRPLKRFRGEHCVVEVSMTSASASIEEFSSITATTIPKKEAKKKDTFGLLSTLPQDALAHCLGFLNTESDRFALQATCKQFRTVSNSDNMLVNVKVGGDPDTGKHGIVQPEDTPETAAVKLAPYAQAGNLEAIYMLGMIKSYCHQDVETGIRLLKKASAEGYVRSSYALGLVLRDSKPEEAAKFMKLAADEGYLPALQELLPAREMKAKYGEPNAEELRRHLDPVCLNLLLGRHYVHSAELRELNTSHCWNPLCGRWAFKASAVSAITADHEPPTERRPWRMFRTGDAEVAQPANADNNSAAGDNNAGPRAGPADAETRVDSSGTSDESFPSQPNGHSHHYHHHRHHHHYHTHSSGSTSSLASAVSASSNASLTSTDVRVSRMKMCSRCCRAKYCSKLCQVYDWRSGRHKMECQFL